MLPSNDWYSRVGLALREAVLDQIEEGGLTTVHVGAIASRLEIGIGTLYRRWGGRQMLLEHTWRMCLEELDLQVRRALPYVGSHSASLDRVLDLLLHGVPRQTHAFLELHSARRQWTRSASEPDGLWLPGLLAYVELGQRLGHLRPGPPLLVANVIWWMLMGACSGLIPHDRARRNWCLGALHRSVLSAEAFLAELRDDDFEITVEEPRWSEKAVLPSQGTPERAAP